MQPNQYEHNGKIPTKPATPQSSKAPGILRLVFNILHCWPTLKNELDLKWLRYRLVYGFKLYIGVLEHQIRAYTWAAKPLGAWLKPDVPSTPESYRAWRSRNSGRFFFDKLFAVDSSSIRSAQPFIDEADGLLAGKWRFFSKKLLQLDFPPDWHLQPLFRQHIEPDRHWSKYGDFENGDIKLLWELSRFNYVYPLVLAYAATGEEKYPEAFWTLVEDWRRHNPPNKGLNWKCGQEVSIRVRAWCFGLYGFSDSASTTPDRVALLSAMIAAHAQRIQDNISYAKSQKNNHIISEALGLFTVGLLFPEFQQSQQWQSLGREIIEEETVRQIYPDGSYIMHSRNYHRSLLHNLIWALTLVENNGGRFSDQVYQRVESTIRFLYLLTDHSSGDGPNYGPNDGTLLLPLNTCDYADFRAVLQTAYYLVRREHLYPPGPWDNDLLWLFGPEALKRRSTPDKRNGRYNPELIPTPSTSFNDGGYYVLRGRDTWAMVRCTSYRDRPAHADQLHFDLWWRGVNITCDAGTYLYNPPDSLNMDFSDTSVHNTVTVDAENQMVKVSRFLWLNWSQGKVLRQVRTKEGQVEYWEGEHNGYRRLTKPVSHRRAVLRLGHGYWLVLDQLSSMSSHDCRLQWLFPDFPYEYNEADKRIRLVTPVDDYYCQAGVTGDSGKFSLVRASSDSARGWRSRSYWHLEPALSAELKTRADSCLFWTLFSPEAIQVSGASDNFQAKGQNWEARLQLGTDNQQSLVSRVFLSDGSVENDLVISA